MIQTIDEQITSAVLKWQRQWQARVVFPYHNTIYTQMDEVAGICEQFGKKDTNKEPGAWDIRWVFGECCEVYFRDRTDAVLFRLALPTRLRPFRD